MRPKLLIIGAITPQMETELNARFTLCFDKDIENKEAFIAENKEDISYILTNGHDGVPSDYMTGLPHLKVISNYGVGYDAIDVNYAASNNIVVTHTPDVLNEEVATTALMLMLSCYRELLYNDAHVRSGAWVTDGNARLSRSADNRKVGIIGLGRIGQAIARKLAPFNADILYHNRREKDVPYRYFANLTEMARAADVVIAITPGGEATKHIVNKDVLEAIGPDGIFINVSRGSVVDEEALVACLESGALGAAGLDVFAAEPHVPDALKTMSQVVLQPHVGSATTETRAAMGQLTVDNLIRYHETGAVFTPVPECADIAVKSERS